MSVVGLILIELSIDSTKALGHSKAKPKGFDNSTWG